MSRQRLKPTLSEGSSIPCPRCGGSGHIRDTESSALQILRVIQEESLKDSTAAVLVQVPVEVASFLLNEKRTEITKIELKQRINVLLVPNKSLDTPNYKLERLKHDDPRLDNLDSSYKLAEEVDDPTSFTRRSQERTNKQEPVIKGVLPDSPAPVAAPKPEAAPVAAAPAPVAAPTAVAPQAKPAAEKGFFGWLKSLFGGGAAAPAPAPAAEVAPAPAAKTGEREARGEGRRDGRGRGGRGSEGRTPREGREGREGGRDGQRGQGGRNGEARADGRGEAREGNRAPRGEGRGDQPRNENGRGEGRNGGRRENRRDNAPAETTDTQLLQTAAAPGVVAEATSAPEAAEGQRRERRPRNENRRRGEGAEAAPQSLIEAAAQQAEATAQDARTEAAPEAEGENAQRAPRERRSRDRYGRDRRERAPRETSLDASAAETPVSVEAEASAEPAPTRSSYFTMPVESAPAAEPVVAAAAAAPAVEAVPVLDVQPAVAPRPVAAAPAPVVQGLPKVQPYTVSIEELSRIAQASGLEWVNSDAGKVAAVQAAIAAEPKPIHVARAPKPVVLVDEGPLVLVETRKDLRNMPLPFENR